MDRLSKTERSKLMARVRVKDTDIEKILGEIIKPLWKIERYRKNVKTLPGRPDIVFPKSKIAIFADGDFWHGHYYKKEKHKWDIFWQDKIKKNVSRDNRQKQELKGLGYKVIRFWGSDLKKNPEKSFKIIEPCVK
jgi:DNA mismatch endonuclease (patch repair protein)